MPPLVNRVGRAFVLGALGALPGTSQELGSHSSAPRPPGDRWAHSLSLPKSSISAVVPAHPLPSSPSIVPDADDLTLALQEKVSRLAIKHYAALCAGGSGRCNDAGLLKDVRQAFGLSLTTAIEVRVQHAASRSEDPGFRTQPYRYEGDITLQFTGGESNASVSAKIDGWPGCTPMVLVATQSINRSWQDSFARLSLNGSLDDLLGSTVSRDDRRLAYKAAYLAVQRPGFLTSWEKFLCEPALENLGSAYHAVERLASSMRQFQGLAIS